MTKRREYPTQERLRELFDYDPEGFLVWRDRKDVPRRVNTRFAGKRAGYAGVSEGRDGKITKNHEIRINNVLYRAQALVYIFHNGEIPEGKTVTSASGSFLFSRIEDLILVDGPYIKESQHFMRFSSGRFVGVQERNGRYICAIRGRKGTFSTPEAAASAYNFYARKIYGDHAILNEVEEINFNDYLVDMKIAGQKGRRDKKLMLGVYSTKQGMFEAKLKNSYLGSYYTEEQAARAYNIAARKYYGDNCIINDIENPLGEDEYFVLIPKQFNKGIHKKKSRYRAVYDRKSYGEFDNEDDAKRAYNVVAYEKEGKGARIHDVERPFSPPAKGGFYKNNIVGVHRYPSGRYGAKFCNKGLGTFDTKEQAARAYNRAAREKYGEHAVLNDIPDPLGDGAPI